MLGIITHIVRYRMVIVLGWVNAQKMIPSFGEKMKCIATFIMIFLACAAHAEEIFPADCTPLVVKGMQVNVPAKKSMVTMIHNLSSTDLWIAHSDKSGSWSSHLQAGHWSALVLPNEAFEWSCIESIPGHEQQVSCSNVLAVCQWSAATLPRKPSDTVWAAEDMLLSPLIAYIGRQGFVLAPLAQ